MADRQNMKTGSVFEILPTSCARATVMDVIIGTVVNFRETALDPPGAHVKSSKARRKNGNDPRLLSLMIYCSVELSPGDFFRVHPVDSLLPQARQFEACICQLFWPIGFADVLSKPDNPRGCSVVEEHPNGEGDRNGSSNGKVCRRNSSTSDGHNSLNPMLESLSRIWGNSESILRSRY